MPRRRPAGRPLTVDPDIDHHGAGGDPVAAHQFRLADGCHQNVGPPAFRREVAGAGMRDRDGGIGTQQQCGHRPADDAGAAQHQGARAGQRGRRPPPAASSLRAECTAPGQDCRQARRPAFSGWKPSTSLSGSIASITACVPICAGSGNCTRMASMAGSAFSRASRVSSAASDVSAGRRIVCAAMPRHWRRGPWRARRPRWPDHHPPARQRALGGTAASRRVRRALPAAQRRSPSRR